jgi:hypothetical protein
MWIIALVASVLTTISALLFVEGVWLWREHRANVAAQVYAQRLRSDHLRALSRPRI